MSAIIDLTSRLNKLGYAVEPLIGDDVFLVRAHLRSKGLAKTGSARLYDMPDGSVRIEPRYARGVAWASLQEQLGLPAASVHVIPATRRPSVLRSPGDNGYADECNVLRIYKVPPFEEGDPYVWQVDGFNTVTDQCSMWAQNYSSFELACADLPALWEEYINV